MPPARRGCCGDAGVRSLAWSCAAGTAWNGIDAVPDVPGVAQINLRLVQPADVAGPHLRLQTLPRFRRDAFRHAAPPRRRQQSRQAAFAIALPPALNGSYTIAQDLRGVTDARDPPLLEKPKHPDPIGPGLVPSRPLRG